MDRNDAHAAQKRAWDAEHSSPHILHPMDSHEPSSGVQLFGSWLNKQFGSLQLQGLEMGCGKGRNTIWLAKQGTQMCAFDFSSVAIEEARRRGRVANVHGPEFTIHDATTRSPYPDCTFDFVLDCFASTDIESARGRAFARDEIFRVLRPGGVLLLYTLSTEDEFHSEMLARHPAEEPNSFRHPSNGKFEKVFDRKELLDLFPGRVLEERRIEKPVTFFGKSYRCKHFWMVIEKTGA